MLVADPSVGNVPTTASVAVMIGICCAGTGLPVLEEHWKRMVSTVPDFVLEKIFCEHCDRSSGVALSTKEKYRASQVSVKPRDEAGCRSDDLYCTPKFRCCSGLR
jgi:hypothetical protein